MLTDDQDLELGSMNAMSFTAALGRTGANFTTFFAHTPVCCPSRSELLAGKYFHNLKNSGFEPSGCMHINTTTGTPTGDAPAFSTALKAAGCEYLPARLPARPPSSLTLMCVCSWCAACRRHGPVWQALQQRRYGQDLPRPSR